MTSQGMRKLLSRASSTILALSVASMAAANPGVVQQLAMDQVHWSFTGDRFHCELELDLKKNGNLLLSHPAGAPMQVHYRPAQGLPAEVSLASRTAPWQGDRQSQATALTARDDHFRLDQHTSRSVLTALDSGLWTSLYLDTLELRIPTVNWAPVADRFRQCEQQLSPLSVHQARDQVVFYQAGQRALSPEQIADLEDLARYVQLDPQVRKLLVDGHTDNTGSRLGNLQIARERAADVAAVLKAAGIPGTMIEQRAHGDRYPSANNDTTEGRDLNRRVTIRIVRQETEETS